MERSLAFSTTYYNAWECMLCSWAGAARCVPSLVVGDARNGSRCLDYIGSRAKIYKQCSSFSKWMDLPSGCRAAFGRFGFGGGGPQQLPATWQSNSSNICGILSVVLWTTTEGFRKKLTENQEKLFFEMFFFFWFHQSTDKRALTSAPLKVLLTKAVMMMAMLQKVNTHRTPCQTYTTERLQIP